MKSPNDSRNYRHLELKNGLSVLLVSDPSAEKAAASLDVHVGSRNDPEGREGLAHFLEHMLFLGTEKYPEPGEYQQFVSENGGSHNAFTSFEHTNYFFDIDNDALPAALDRFADFFVAPLLNSKYIDREMNAVESEYRARYQDESRRVLDAMKSITNPQHPFSKFTVGSLETLADAEPEAGLDSGAVTSGIQADLLAFYQRYYTASQMTLVVLGSDSLDQLADMVVERFSAIRNNGTLPEPIEQPLVEVPTLLTVVPEKPVRELRMGFEVPDYRPYYQRKPLHYIGNLLGHEGSGSLLSTLKSRGWAESLSAGAGFVYRGGATFQVSISLTDSGVSNYIDVVDAVFEALALIEAQGVQEWRFEEDRQLSETAFRFFEKRGAVGTAIHLASNLHVFPPQDAIYGDYAYTRYDPELIQQYLSYLVPERALVTLVSKNLPAEYPVTHQSKWFATDYGSYAIPGDWLQSWSATGNTESLSLPTKNNFVPNDFTLRGCSSAGKSTSGEVRGSSLSVDSHLPESVLKQPGIELRFLQDSEFCLPRADVFFSFLTRMPMQSVQNAALARLYASVVNDQLSEYLYPAALAGMSYSFYPHARGFSLKFGGYNDSLPALMTEVIPNLERVEIDADRFDNLKQELIRKIELGIQATPYRRLASLTSKLLYNTNWTDQQLIQQIQSASRSDLRAFVSQLWGTVYIDGLVHGNYSPQTLAPLLDLASDLSHCECDLAGRTHLDVLEIPGGQSIQVVELNHSDAALSWYFQAPDDSLVTAAATMLAADILHPLFFNQLRTEQQLGYVVGVGYFPAHRLPGLRLQVQSPVATAVDLRQAISIFVKESPAIPDLASRFDKHRSALAASLRERDQTLAQRSARLWHDIALSYPDYDSREQLATALDSLEFEQWQTVIQQMLVGEPQSLLMSTAPLPLDSGDKPWLPNSGSASRAYR